MVLHILGIVFPIFAIVLVGFLYARKHRPDMAVANKVNLDVFIPALVFSVLSGKDFHIQDYKILAVAGIAVVLGSGVLAWIVARVLKLNVRTFVPPMMFNNSGNMGLPLTVFAFGPAALPAAVVLFLIENLSHFTVGVMMLDRKPNLWRVFKIPMVVSSLLGVAISLIGYEIWQPLAETIQLLGQISIPLLLFALGVRLVKVDLSDWRLGVIGAIVCPLSGLIIALAMIAVLDLQQLQISQLIVFSVLPPAVLNYMMAERYQQEPTKVASIVMIGNLASVVVVPLSLYFVL